MGDRPDKDLVFVTISMAEILLSQNLVSETRRVLEELRKSDPENPRVIALAERLKQVSGAPPLEQTEVTTAGLDAVELFAGSDQVTLKWELTPEGLAIARQRAQYSGRNIARIFTAVPGPRGVRTGTRDIELLYIAGEAVLRGLPRPAVHVAAVGFLANTGVFVPLARSASLKVSA
jgi:hypothetical protein